MGGLIFYQTSFWCFHYTKAVLFFFFFFLWATQKLLLKIGTKQPSLFSLKMSLCLLSPIFSYFPHFLTTLMIKTGLKYSHKNL